MVRGGGSGNDALNWLTQAFEHQSPVGATKTKVVFHGDFNAEVTRGVGAVVQIALRVLVEDVDGWRAFLVVNRQNGKHTFNATSTAQQMPGHRFGGVNDGLLGMVAKSQFDGVGFVQIAQWR